MLNYSFINLYNMFSRLQAKNLNDISVVLALYRPDTMSALNDYIDAKNGIKVIHNIHPDLDKILKYLYLTLLVINLNHLQFLLLNLKFEHLINQI